MIYTERKITISNSGASIDSPIILYRGDKEIEILFTIVDSKFKFSSEKGNYIINTGAKFAQLAVDLPDGTDLFTDISECLDGAVLFKITGDMIDEIREIGFYSFHIRLFDESKKSRITIPPVLKGIEIKSPMVTESTVGYATADNSRVDDNEESFIDEDGKLTIEWKKGDVISSVKLNQMVEVVNNAVDEEKQRQQNELIRQNNEEIRQDAIEYAVETYDMTINDLNAEKNKIKPYVDDILESAISEHVISFTEVEGSVISERSFDGYLKDLEILGNTIQDADNLADIRSVGDKVENQELYEIPVLCTNGLDSSDSNYKEHKLTILSPTPLERVGDVADRIVCKDGVWGVEKNIKTYVFSGNEFNGRHTFNNGGVYFKANIIRDILYSSWNVLCNNAVGKQLIAAYNDLSTYAIYFDAGGYFRITGADFQNMATTNEANEWAKSKGLYIKYPTTQPTFVPLPYDQQVKLRTFANKTNISFGCEIEPTLKASVPKSLGATVNTHTEQIDNLGKELDRVKKLEESTTLTITTESDFTTVEATSNGYFEDVKLEGRTLVNLYPKLDAKNYEDLSGTISDDTITINADGNWHNFKLKKDVLQLKASTYYTFVIDIIENTLEGNDNFPLHFGETLESEPSKFSDEYLPFIQNKKSIYTFKLKTKDSFDNTSNDTRDFLSNTVTGGTIVFKYMILEGDHTQNPPEYFEGLKSVGQDVDEISVLSTEKNIVNHITQYINSESSYYEFSPITSNDVYYNNISDKNIRIHVKDKNGYVKYIIIKPNSSKKYELVNNQSVYAVTLNFEYGWDKKLYDINSIFSVTKSAKQDKKRILYYNDETQTWEKPILRQWDSIEKHSDGKYYYHKRSGEVVLNGSEDWACEPPMENTIYGICTVNNVKYLSEIRCDKFKGYNYSLYVDDIEGIYTAKNIIKLKISSSKLSSQDVQGFKAWLQANPTTVVYQLAEEKVYECTNLDLITYENETNFIVNTGAIAPLTTLKVMRNINNVVRELQQKVSNLENYIQHVMIDALNNALNE